MTKKATTWLMISYTAVMIAWDIFMAANGAPNDTESEIIRDFAFRHPTIAVAICLLVTHFFVPRRQFKALRLPMMSAMIAGSITTIVLDLTGNLPLDLFGLPQYLGLIPYCTLGLALGLLWPQKAPKELYL